MLYLALHKSTNRYSYVYIGETTHRITNAKTSLHSKRDNQRNRHWKIKVIFRNKRR